MFLGPRYSARLASSTLPLILLAATPAWALTIEQAVERVLAVDPLLGNADERLASARLERSRSRQLLPSNPYFSTTVSSSTFEQSSGGDSQPGELAPDNDQVGPALTFFLEQEIELAGQRSLRIESADRHIRIAELNRAQAQRNAVAKLKTAFVAALVQRDLAANEKDSLHWERQALAGRPASERQGIREELERSDAEARVWRARRARRSAAHAYDEAVAYLRRLLRMAVAEPIAIEGALPASFDRLPPLEQLLLTAREQRADLASQRALVEWSSLQLTLSERNQIPNVSISGFFSQQDGDQQFGGGVGFPLPLFESSKIEIRAAAIDLDKAKADLAALDDRIAAEVQAAHAACQAAAGDAQMIHDQILPRLRRIAVGRDQLFDQGRASAGEIIDAEMALLDAQRDYIAAVGDYATAVVELERTLGAPLAVAKVEGSAPPPPGSGQRQGASE